MLDRITLSVFVPGSETENYYRMKPDLANITVTFNYVGISHKSYNLIFVFVFKSRL